MWLDIQIFGFRALWSPYFITFLLLVALLYFLITGPYRVKFGHHDKPTAKQQIAFYFSLILLYVAKGSPVDLLSHILFTAHMVQMAIFLLLVPILFIKGIPKWMWEKVINLPVVRVFFKIFTKPLIPLITFNLLFSLYHIPSVFDFSKSSRPVHFAISLVLLAAAFMMWWVVMSPIKEHNKLKPLLKMLYMAANSALITPACVLIIFASAPVFQAYSSEGAWLQALSLCVPVDVLQGLSGSLSGADMFSPMTTVEDQQLGGIVMKILTEIVYGSVIGSVFFRWFKPAREHQIDPLPESTSHSL